MDRASVSRIEAWDSRPVSGGFVGLNELADAGFTGAVAAGETRLVMLNGRVVGVFDGSIDAFENGEVRAFEAPDPALPLLFSMQEGNGEVRGKYYTDDTSIGEVDETLSEGGFTGYLELSENVLSGDYYVVYYGGRSLWVAFLGNERRVVTGEEARRLAEDEVGIYEVRSVDLDVTDVPEPPEDAGSAASTGSADDEPEAEGGDDSGEAAVAIPEAEDDDPRAEEDDEPVEDPEDEIDVEGTQAGADSAEADDSEVAQPEESDDETEAEAAQENAGDAAEAPTDTREEPSASSTDDEGSGADPSGPGTGAEAASGEVTGNERTDRAVGASDDRPRAERPNGASAAQRRQPGREPDRDVSDERFEEEARWRESRTVPALDPDETELPSGRSPAEPTERADPTPQATATENDVHDDAVTTLRERVRRLEAELEASERERRTMAERLESTVDERDRLADERDELVERIEALEGRLEAAEAAAANAADTPATHDTSGQGVGSAGVTVDPDTALDQTDLFVRYGSKGKATLQSAHQGSAGPEEVAENLRIESHSQFDAATATVDGAPFDEFLRGTIQYRFVSWLVEKLLYEIRDTGTESELRALYDLLPHIDRAEFNGTVTSRDEEGNETTETFDVICRNRMGKPLVVANLNDSLDPATGDMMVRLVEDATAAGESHESMGAAFFVTASFFEPDALETVADATRGGGFLSRDSKKSFVKLARSGGYHLCLVEARGDDFHVAVPEF